MEVCEASRLEQARHPYTQGLLNCLPRVEGGGSEDLPVLNRDPAWLELDL
jgi:peptide/nickel transport system ATP-binding protein